MSWPKEMQPGGFFDIKSISGNIKGIIFGFFVFWYSYEIFTWIDDLMGIERKFSSEDRVAHRKVLGVSLGGGVVSIFLTFLIRLVCEKIKGDYSRYKSK